ncbi:helix-turn-helix domain-containing protein [Methylobacterium sp. J-092]|uniref:helix-turn-helix domain-containing protein n=1 Tax=Methylobacterium sp. J-092 TaxID=2836667 RepID=UPI0028C40BD4|nr:helix-turn-helix domain-containing protein [Methylobacterium sp. J-092]
MAKAKAEGAFKGRKPSIDATKVRELAASGLKVTAIARALNVSRASVYRLLGPDERS